MSLVTTSMGLMSNVRDFRELDTLKKSYFDEFADRDSNLILYYLASVEPEAFEELINQVGRNNKKFDIETNLLDARDNRELFSVFIRHEKFKITNEGYLLADVDHADNIVTILTDEGSDLVESSMQVTDRMYPRFEKLDISTDNILTVLNSFVEAGYQGRCRQFSAQRWWEKGHKPESLVEYPTDVPLESVLDELERPSIALNMFHGYLELDEEDLLEFYLSRDGEIRYEYGRYPLFEELTSSIKDQALADVKKLENISKEDAGRYLEIQFEDIVEEKEQDIIIERFREAVSKERTFAEGIIHAGNPYYHSSVTDRDGGTSFDIIFARDDWDFQLNILPNRELSKLSVLKFKKAIFSEFGEGEIKRMQHQGG